jgi:hypothetical protein
VRGARKGGEIGSSCVFTVRTPTPITPVWCCACIPLCSALYWLACVIGAVSLLCGTVEGHIDGHCSVAQFTSATDVVLAEGMLYVSETTIDGLRAINLETGMQLAHFP